MNNPEWYFKPLEPGGTTREPIHGEFFSVDAISNPATSLIREAFQNSLDASDKKRPVRIRIYLSGDDAVLDTRNTGIMQGGLWKHIQAKDSGINNASAPTSEFKMPFLIIEDFGTTGLTGSVNAPFRPRDDSKNHFYHFFRAEGQSDKGSAARGSWGIGKFVFYRSSRISTLFCYTVTEDTHDNYFMGKSILKSHYLKREQVSCYQDGYFGKKDPLHKDMILPVDDPEYISHIKKHFRIKRELDQPGLSVIIPWPDEDITEHAILMAVLKDYFYPVITGQLTVDIETGNDSVTELNRDTIAELTEEQLFESDSKDLPYLIRFSQEVVKSSDQRSYELNAPESGKAWNWSDDMFPESIIDNLRTDFLSYKPIVLKVPVEVRAKNKQPESSYFQVFMKRSSADLPIRQVFIREGIIIPRVNTHKLRATMGIFYADDEPIASFLRDSENPSHTEWQYGSTKFKGKYVSGRSDISFIRKSISYISDFLTSQDEEEDREILSSFFPMTDEVVEHRKRTKPKLRKKGEEPDIPDIDVPQRSQKLYIISNLENGFRIRGDKSAISEEDLPFDIVVKAGYEIRQGDPIKRHSLYDFDFREPDQCGLSIKHNGIEIISIDCNAVRFKVEDILFMYEVRGFDKKRDVYLRIRKHSST